MKVLKMLLAVMALSIGWETASRASCGLNCATYKCWKSSAGVYQRYKNNDSVSKILYDDPNNNQMCNGTTTGKPTERYAGNEAGLCGAPFVNDQPAALTQCTGNFIQDLGHSGGCNSCLANP